ncbi:MAG TPA: hypothetical protein VGN95_20465 [Pyrinomonadaceae bacterium]|nr:hypothetical protein [Pyrinomonadaceae bacterium]
MVDAPDTLSCCLGTESRHGSRVNPASYLYIQRPATSQVNPDATIRLVAQERSGSIAFAAIGAQTFLHLIVHTDTRPPGGRIVL